MFSGKVIIGKGVGKKLGFPTANLDIQNDRIGLRPGIYAVNVLWGRKKYMGALVVQNSLPAEVHLLNYTGPDFYGVTLRIEPIQKISKITVIKTQKQLKEKIKADVEEIRKFFRRLTPVHR